MFYYSKYIKPIDFTQSLSNLGLQCRNFSILRRMRYEQSLMRDLTPFSDRKTISVFPELTYSAEAP